MPVKDVLERYSKDQVKKAAQIKAIFFEVDGVLTDGKITYEASGRESLQFHVRDGYILKRLKDAGVIIGIISSRESDVAGRWAVQHKLDFCHQGIVDKYAVFEKLVAFHKLKKKQVIFIGNEMDDLKVLRTCGLSICPPDAPAYIRKEVQIRTQVTGGSGVLREVADLVLAGTGALGKMLN